MNSFVHPKARLGNQCTLGHGSVILEDVELGDECVVGHGVVIHPHTRIGHRVKIDDRAVLGKHPRAGAVSVLKIPKTLPSLEVGDDCFIGAGSVIYTGATLHKKVFVADLATVREGVAIEVGVIIGRGVCVENACRIGEYTKVETNAYIAAYTVIEERCFIAPMVCFTNDNFLGRTEERFKHMKGAYIKRGARIGANAVVFPGLFIGEEAVVGAGAVVTRDVPPYQVVTGVPAKYLRDTPQEQLLKNCLPDVWAELLARDRSKEGSDHHR